jgi:glutamine synthetase
MTPPSYESCLATIREESVAFINLWFTDIEGHVKTVTIPAAKFDDAFEHGVWFDGSSIEGFARIFESDMYLVPDLSTFRVIPWDVGANRTARIICDVYTPDGEPFPGDPREVLRRVLKEAEAMGYRYLTGPEPEFFLLQRDEDGEPMLVPHDAAGYFDVSTDLGTDIRRQMVHALEDMGIEVEAAHHEVAVGQHEIDFRYGDALQTADNVVTLRVAVKAVAQANGLHATFMPKPIAGINGSGMHVHQSLARASDGENAFMAPGSELGLSDVALSFVAGQLAHAKGFAAVVAPTINSYKRLVPGFEAPVYISWARHNRSALIRVPRISPGRPQSTRVELRCPDPSANPYLAFAVMLKAGLDGIARGLTPPAPAEEDLYHLEAHAVAARNLDTLPGSLGLALDLLAADTVLTSALGEHVTARFMEAKRQEWDSYRLHVSGWETDQYLATF